MWFGLFLFRFPCVLWNYAISARLFKMRQLLWRISSLLWDMVWFVLLVNFFDAFIVYVDGVLVIYNHLLANMLLKSKCFISLSGCASHTITAVRWEDNTFTTAFEFLLFYDYFVLGRLKEIEKLLHSYHKQGLLSLRFNASIWVLQRIFFISCLLFFLQVLGCSLSYLLLPHLLAEFKVFFLA